MQTTRVIRFYQPVLIDERGQRSDFADGFWAGVGRNTQALPVRDRATRHNGVQFFGSFQTAKVPALAYLRIGRVRYAADWPETIDMSAGDVQPLSLNSRQLLESAFLVPFGRNNQVAVMGPLRGSVSVTAMESWLTHTTGLVKLGQSVELVPEIDKKMEQKLSNAIGVSRVSVRVPVDSHFEGPGNMNGGIVEAALNQGTAQDAQAYDVEMTWSLGNRKKDSDLIAQLLRGARYLARSKGPERIDVSLMIADGKSYRIEQHDLLRDQISHRVKFDIDETQQVDEQSVLSGIQDAIKAFHAR